MGSGPVPGCGCLGALAGGKGGGGQVVLSNPKSNPLEPLLNPIDVKPWNRVPPFETPPLARLSCPYPSATLAPLHLTCLRQASCPVLLVKSFGHLCNSCGKEYANGEGGVATVLLFPQTSLHRSRFVNHMEFYGTVAVKFFWRQRRKRRHEIEFLGSGPLYGCTFDQLLSSCLVVCIFCVVCTTFTALTLRTVPPRSMSPPSYYACQPSGGGGAGAPG